ncbi:hypothetical protein GCM10010431_50320 [Streptomyces kunmingensis]
MGEDGAADGLVGKGARDGVKGARVHGGGVPFRVLTPAGRVVLSASVVGRSPPQRFAFRKSSTESDERWEEFHRA